MGRRLIGALLLCFSPSLRGVELDPACLRVATTDEFLAGTPPATLKALTDPVFRQNLITLVTSMQNQVAGTPTGDAKPVKLPINPVETRNDHYYLVANYNRAVNGAVAPVMEANNVAPSQLKPSKTLVVVVHQFRDTGDVNGRTLQTDTAKAIKDHFPGDPVLVVSSDVFALRNPALLAEVKRQGALVFSYDGRLLHTDAAGKEIHRDVTVDVDKLVFAGGQVTECMKRTVQDSIRMAMSNPARKTLEVQILPKQSYDFIGQAEARITTVHESYRSQKDRVGLAAGFLPDRTVWRFKETEYGDTQRRLQEEGKITFVHKDTKQELTIDFNGPS